MAEKLNQIQHTKNYEKFKILDTNRQINNTHLNKLILSMEKNYIPTPAIVDKDMYIRDGQHRFMACKTLDIPFAYIITDIDDKDMINLNQYQKSWTANDYINYYARKEYRHYFVLSETIKMTGLTHQVIILFSNPKIDRKHIPSLIKSGNLVFNEDEFYLNYNKYEEIIKCLKIKQLSKMSEVSPLLKGVFAHPDYIHETMLEKCSKYGRANYYRCGTFDQGLEMWQKIYNFNTRSGSTIDFVTDYKKN